MFATHHTVSVHLVGFGQVERDDIIRLELTATARSEEAWGQSVREWHHHLELWGVPGVHIQSHGEQDTTEQTHVFSFTIYKMSFMQADYRDLIWISLNLLKKIFLLTYVVRYIHSPINVFYVTKFCLWFKSSALIKNEVGSAVNFIRKSWLSKLLKVRIKLNTQISQDFVDRYGFIIVSKTNNFNWRSKIK